MLKYRDEKDISACGIFGIMDRKGRRFNGKLVIEAMSQMKVRGNGLGAGFAVYGLYKKFKEYYAFHVMIYDKDGREKLEKFLSTNFDIVYVDEIPVNDKAKVIDPPKFMRYFVAPRKKGTEKVLNDDDFVVKKVMYINRAIPGVYVISSGKNMGVFKGVGFPEDIADYFMIEEYKGYIWTAHTRFPTNTPGWWGGAHPFSILDWSVVHNGEISSYGTNKRYLEMYGYYSTLQTDTEVITYIFDLLVRRQGLPIEVVSKILAPPMWEEIDRMPEKEKKFYKALRMVYSPILLNGPWAIIVARHGEMIGLTDRIRLRPLTVAEKKSFLIISSEEAPIRYLFRDVDRIYTPYGGELVVGKLEEDIKKFVGESQ
ncbi:hypothetical protein PFDSM3638_00965 [Pyrococcus furiosus DSM 3638]|uniref:Glutamine amidotransferase type-2 domain-containing protein n=3 Tax=Pyrococcus furiosus TaxID=2261 RepID=A0A5C0XT57_PYRFU|nr:MULTISPECIES: glutamine amidotransferase family protein [Pyrococcus]AAL80328.1 hypothetical protein PF0204 [Pyrococcus furiosus DSM 3638]AFN02992.1 hypothetical protein PFC_00080 [Pyrococcus furiosus COM1]MDK2869212.1 hypothetical protein [Pyrococcus sp.]QEK77930.1 hypothetical protein PFDSM3638_00965 [Pyrococcus furiosus DSM 3638]